MEIQEWILDWFKENTQADIDDMLGNLNANYFDMGWMDSLAFITFLSDVEGCFHINFENDVFEDRSFSTISGLTKLIEERL